VREGTFPLSFRFLQIPLILLFPVPREDEPKIGTQTIFKKKKKLMRQFRRIGLAADGTSRAIQCSNQSLNSIMLLVPNISTDESRLEFCLSLNTTSTTPLFLCLVVPTYIFCNSTFLHDTPEWFRSDSVIFRFRNLTNSSVQMKTFKKVFSLKINPLAAVSTPRDRVLSEAKSI